MTIMLLVALVAAFVVSAITCALALAIFPWFRSGERKEGHFRPDQSSGSMRVDLTKGVGRLRTSRAGSNELPLVGGPSMILAICIASVGTALFLQLGNSGMQLGDIGWKLLAILLAAMVGYGLVGFFDDWRKVHRGEGISEIQKFGGVLFVSLLAAVALNRLIVSPRLSARLAYPPYSDFPLLGSLLVHTHYSWIVFFLVMTATVASSTALAVDFADGMDGLGGGLLVSASLSFAAIVLGEGSKELWPAAIAVLAIAGAAGGFLPFNWPSSWKARNQGRGPRRARIIMGDSGSLALGGLLALAAVISRLEFVLLFIGGIFVLEGLSALISARILVRFFRTFLRLERFNSSGKGFPHTEFPLPFLATPMHHHFDLLGWDRKRLVLGAWLLSAGLGVLGVASVIGTFTWQRYLARFVAFLVLVAVWQSGPWTRSFFIGLTRPLRSAPEAPRHLALYYGSPYRLFGRPLYARVDTTDITESALQSPAERLTLWQRMSGFDARALLGYYCYRMDAFEDALRLWSRIPKGNLERRPDIEELVAEVRHVIAVQADNAPDAALISVGSGVHRLGSAASNGASNGANALDGLDPNATSPTQTKIRPYRPEPFANNRAGADAYSLPQTPPASDPFGAPPADRANGFQGLIADEAPQYAQLQDTSTLWNAATWAAVSGATDSAPPPEPPATPPEPSPVSAPKPFLVTKPSPPIVPVVTKPQPIELVPGDLPPMVGGGAAQ